MKKAIFLDRDGTLIEDKGYVYKIEDFKLHHGVIEGLRLLKYDYLFFIITNQSGIEKGLYTTEDFHKFNNFLLEQLRNQNIEIEKTFFALILMVVTVKSQVQNTLKKLNLNLRLISKSHGS